MNKEYKQLKQIFDEFAESKGFREDVDDLTYWCNNKEILMKFRFRLDVISITLEYVCISTEPPFVKSGAYARHVFDIDSLQDISLDKIFNKLKEELEAWSVKK